MEDQVVPPRIALCLLRHDSKGVPIYAVVDSTQGLRKTTEYSPQGPGPVLFIGSLVDCISHFATMTRLLERWPQRTRRNGSSTGERTAGGKPAETRKKGSKLRIGFNTEGPSRGSSL